MTGGPERPAGSGSGPTLRPVRSGRTGQTAWDLWSEGDRGQLGPLVPLVALHGVTDDGGCFAPVLGAWTAGRTVLTVDARGHGRTPLGDPPFTVTALAGDVAAVMDDVLGGPAVVLGHSMGGLVAEELALTRPDLVRALVLEDPAWSAGLVRDVDGRGIPSGIADWIRTATSTPRDVLEAGNRAHEPGWSDAEHVTWAASKERLDPRLAAVDHDWRTRDWVADLAGIAVPVTVVAAAPERGSAIQAGGLDSAAALLGPLLTVVRTSAGHSVRRDAPEVVVAAVLEALQRADA